MRKILISFFAIIFIALVFTSCSESKYKETQIILTTTPDSILKDLTGQEPNSIIVQKYNTDTSIAFLKKDGLTELFVFSTPIRYRDKNGQLVDIDSRIKNVTDNNFSEKGYIYQTAQNDINAYYPKVLSSKKGILLTKEIEYEFGLYCDNDIKSKYIDSVENFVKEPKSMVSYEQKEYNVSFYPSSIGTNCEIIFKRKPEQNTIRFWVKINASNVYMKKQLGGYANIIQQMQTDEGTKESVLGVIQSPVLKTSENTFSCSNDIRTRSIGEKTFEVIFSFDNQKITENSSAFISFEMRREKQPDNSIYSGKSTLMESYLKNISVIGNSQEYGIGQMLIRYDFVKKLGLEENMIEHASYNNYSLTGFSDNFEMLSILEDWCSLTGNWNNHYKTGECVSNAKFSVTNNISFDITDEVRNWCNPKSGKEERFGLKMKSINEKEGEYDIFLTNDNSLYQTYTKIILKN